MAALVDQKWSGHRRAPWYTLRISSVLPVIWYGTMNGVRGTTSSRVPATRPGRPWCGISVSEVIRQLPALGPLLSWLLTMTEQSQQSEGPPGAEAPRPRRRARISTGLARISHALPIFVERFDWKWVFVGAAFIVAGNVGLYLAMRGLIARLIAEDRVMTAAGSLAGAALLIYFFGGVLVGRMSNGRTVKEPAVAGVLGVVVIFVLQLFVGQVNIVGLIVGAPFCFGVAYLGGLVGEKLQARRGVSS